MTLDKERIRDSTDIVELVQSYGIALKKQGNRFKGLCPFHSEKTPSFFVFPDTQSWRCFGQCGESGDVFAFVMKSEDIDFPETLQKVAGKLPPDRKKNRKPPPKIQKQPQISRIRKVKIYQAFVSYCVDISPAHDWLKEHKNISLMTCRATRFDICYLTGWTIANLKLKQQFDMDDLQASGLFNPKGNLIFYQHRLIFPLMAKNDQIKSKFGYVPYYLVGRDINATQKDERMKNLWGNTPDNPPALYNFSAIAEAKAANKPLFICEGITDTLNMYQAGFHTVGVLGNSGLKAHMIPHFAGLKLYLAFDQDKPEATDKAAQMILKGGLAAPYILPLPEDQDLTDILKGQDYEQQPERKSSSRTDDSASETAEHVRT